MFEALQEMPGIERRMVITFILDGTSEFILGFIFHLIGWNVDLLTYLGLSLILYGVWYYIIYCYDKKNRTKVEDLQNHINKISQKRLKA